MQDEGTGKEQLAAELQELRRRVAILESEEEASSRAKEALRESEQKYRTLFEHSYDAILLTVPDGAILDANQAACKMFGRSLDEIKAVGRGGLVDTTDPRLHSALSERVRTGRAKGEITMLRANGDKFPAEITSTVFVDASGLQKTSMIIRDISERRRSHETLKERELRFKKLSAHVPGMIYQFLKKADGTYCVPFTTEAIRDIFGCSPRDVRNDISPIARVVLPEDLDKLVDSIESSAERMTPWQCEYRVQIPGRPVRWMLGQSTPEKLPDGSIIWHGFNTDITERKRAEEEREKLQDQLLQSRKMESIGRLAGGVAHDFNNMLAVIIGHAEMALDKLDSTQVVHSDLQAILKAAQRSANLTRQLLGFARKQTVSPRVLDINETMDGMLRMLQRLIGENIDLLWKPGPDLWPIKIDPTQIDQVLANLCVNARDAIAGVGKVTIETENIVIDETYCRECPELIPGEYVRLSVSDSGCGMDEDVVNHLFEPFFTTKEVGKGTGLGLATIYGIIKQNSGFINVYSEPGQGTTFKMYFPRVAAACSEGERPDREGEELRGAGTILLVEDEEPILVMAKTILEQYGYMVLAACSPAAALNIAGTHPGRIDLLITDVVMPGMSGKDLSEKLRDLKPGFKCIFMSGYTANAIVNQGILDEGIHFLQKPFSVKALAEKVRRVLDS